MPRRSWIRRSWILYRSWRRDTRAIRLALERIAEALERVSPTLESRRPKIGSLTAMESSNRDAAAWDLTERSLTVLYGRKPTDQEILDRLEEATQHLDLMRAIAPRS